METASHNVAASLKVSAAAATENEQQQDEEAPKREVDQSRTAAEVHTKAATVTVAATNIHLKSPPSSDPSASATTKATSMGEATSLKRSAGAALEEGAVLDSSSGGKRPANHKHLKTGRKKKSSAHKKQGATAGRWTPTEHADFLKGLALYGREWKRVAADIPTRSASQVRLFFGGSRQQQQSDLVWFLPRARANVML